MMFLINIFPPANEVRLKVMFLHLSVILFTCGGCLPHCMLGYTPPRGQTPPEQTLPRADTLLGRHHPADSTGYGQQAGGMHPTGMHTCQLFLLCLS